MNIPTNQTPGKVYLVGAGPGHPGLITLRAVECLGFADVVLYDYLANPAALEHASPSAELISLGHHAGGRVCTPDEIITQTIDEARKGKTVVRLKGGDPSIFGRGADEVRELRQAGIPFEVIPGITASLAVAAFCEIPVTHHDGASAVALVAGRERNDKPEPDLDYGTLAEFPGTLVFYMGVTRAGIWSQAMIQRGKSPDTPVAIVRWCSWPEQQMVTCTLGTVTETIKQKKLRPPALFVVGKVVDHAPMQSWFTARPLFGQRVLVATSRNAARSPRNQLCELGAEVVTLPKEPMVDPADWAPVDTAFGQLDQYGCVLFTSSDAVHHFIARLLVRGHDTRRLAQTKLVALSRDAADGLTSSHLRADLDTDSTDPSRQSDALLHNTDWRRFLLVVESEQDHEELVAALKTDQTTVDVVSVCNRSGTHGLQKGRADTLAPSRFDWITVANPAEARWLARLHGDDLRESRLVSIDPATSATLSKLGHEPKLEAATPTMEGIVNAIVDFSASEAS